MPALPDTIPINTNVQQIDPTTLPPPYILLPGPLVVLLPLTVILAPILYCILYMYSRLGRRLLFRYYRSRSGARLPAPDVSSLPPYIPRDVEAQEDEMKEKWAEDGEQDVKENKDESLPAYEERKEKGKSRLWERDEKEVVAEDSSGRNGEWKRREAEKEKQELRKSQLYAV